MPNGVFTPEEYLQALASLLDKWLASGEINQATYIATRDGALTALNEGRWGTDLPYWKYLYSQFTAVEPEPTIGGYDVETRGGYNFAVIRDSEGNILPYSWALRNLGAAEEAGLSAYQQQQLANWNREFEWQQEQAQMQQQQAMMPYQQMTAAQRAQYGLQQQAYRAETMAMPPSGWIEQWYRMQGKPQVGYKPEPKHKRMTEEQYATRFRQTIPKARQAIEGWERGQPLPRIAEMPLRGNWIYIDETTPTRGLITTTIKEPGVEYTPLVGYPGGYAPRPSEIGYQVVSPPPKPPTAKKPSTGMFQPVQKPTTRRPTTPPAPPGLSQFVPSQVTGQPITRAPTTTPSGQQWGQTPWSQQEMLRGYAGWAGYRPLEDVLGHMQQMLPVSPPGAGRKYWTPAYQRA